jgi:hypothetical protein
MLASALALAATGLGPRPAAAAPAASAPVKVLALSLSDVKHVVGSQFKQTLSKGMDKNTVKLQSSAKDKKLFDLHGFESGYISGFSVLHPTVYKNGKLTFTKGITSATSAVFNFKDSSGASWALNYGKTETTAAFKSLKTMHLKFKGLSGLGDTAFQMTSSMSVGKTLGSVSSFTFLWRRGSYLAEVALGGYGAISGSQALALAKLVDSRIDHFG